MIASVPTRPPVREVSRPERGRPLRAALVAWWALVGAGIGLRLVTYAANRSIFIDEAALALSVRDRGLGELLTRPLDYAQTAPAGFLLLLEASTQAFGESEYSLRLPALLAGILSVPLFGLLARRTLPTMGVLVALALFAFGRPLLYYSTEAKPYAIDVLAAVVLLLAVLPIIRREPSLSRLGWTGAAGVMSVWLSQAALFLVASLAPVVLAVLFHRGRRVDARRFFWWVTVPWALSAAMAAAWSLSVYTPQSAEYMRAYWSPGFLPLWPDSLREALWLPIALLTFGLDPLGILLPAVPVVLAALGMARLRRARPVLLALAFAPVLLTLAASAVQAYPFGRNEAAFEALSGRVLHFLIPGALLLVGAGAAALWNRPGVHSRRLACVVLAGTVAAAVAPTLYDFPYTRHEARGVLRELASRRAPGEALFVDYRAQHYFRFYARALELDRGPILWGACQNPDPRAYINEWERLRSYGRVWFLTSDETQLKRRLAGAYWPRVAVEEVRIAAPYAEARRLRFVAGRPILPAPLFRMEGAQRDLELSCMGAWKRSTG